MGCKVEGLGFRARGPGYVGFPKLGVPFWGVPIIRTMEFGSLYWGPSVQKTGYNGITFGQLLFKKPNP